MIVVVTVLLLLLLLLKAFNFSVLSVRLQRLKRPSLFLAAVMRPSCCGS
jgi:hypothetical protein